MLAPPPEADSPSEVVSFQPCSGMYVSAEEIMSLLAEPLQYCVFEVLGASPKNSEPPTPTTSGTAAGTSTAKPVVETLLVPLSQSAAPASPEAAVIVWPCATPRVAQSPTVFENELPRPDSQKP